MNEPGLHNPPVIEIADLAFSLGGEAIIHGLNATLSERRIGIIGRNGSGKSTLARLLAGLIAPSRGQVLLGGHDLAKDRQAALQSVGFIFQNPDHQIIFPTVMEEMAFGLEQGGRSRPEAQEAVRAYLASLDLEAWLTRRTHELSQGQRHLLCLLSVLLMAPQVIVLDEPYAGLDLVTSARLKRWLAGLSQTLLTISHDLELLTGYERVIWLEAGNIAMDGPPKDVIGAYRRAMEEELNHDDAQPFAR